MPSDEELLRSGDPEAFGRFYDRYAETLLGHFARRVRDPRAAAELTAETFAAALVERRRFARSRTPAGVWLCAIAERELAGYRQRGAAGDRMRRHLGVEKVPVDDDDAGRIAALGRESAWQLVDDLARHRVRVLDEDRT
jgi:DNA-directed RNA polymerase specialized sigma24 family protein